MTYCALASGPRSTSAPITRLCPNRIFLAFTPRAMLS
jgi:hypothetical protein